MTETRVDPLDRAPVDLAGAVERELGVPEGLVVAVGAGPGLLRRWRAAGARVVSVGAAGADHVDVVAGVSALPVRDGAAAAVVVLHRLHEVADVDAAFAGIARVLAPGGRVVLSANALGDRRELRGLWATAARDCGVVPPPPFLAADESFPLDHAQAWLARHFETVEVTPLRGTSVLDLAEVLAFVRAQRPAEAGVTWDLLASVVERKVREVVAAEGGFAVSTLVGIGSATRAATAEVPAPAKRPARSWARAGRSR
ncbi:methyltransferase domain-containing protein [Actinokineospora sp. NBRC 105648]|uniref:methyltransferase domain-containing protein n=1 Tax=Actinokineospora sp. NBRC 105648 TaxID=3032206 RepID=UPI0024A3CED4|nr:methyltransferase domain-containing protein [Actinokineospora sp. NBRC 105648]GLZ37249.1 hypothetical protein Acsp05_08740 [Actinokineospora sp. NBRC 105648]